MKNLLFSLTALILGASSVATQAASVAPEIKDGGSNVKGMALRHRSTGYDRLTMNMPTASTRSDEVGTPITEAPEGIKKIYSSGGYALYPDMWDIVFEERTERPAQIIEGEDGYVYIYNPILSYTTNSYMKCERKGEKLVATLPQPIYNLEWMGEVVRSFHLAVYDIVEDLKDEDDWVTAYVENTEITEVTFSIAEDGSISLDLNDGPTYDGDGNFELPKRILTMGDADGGWCQYGDCTQTYIPFNEQPVELPDDAQIEKWSFFSEQYGEEAGQWVNVAIVGNSFYLTGLDNYCVPDAWIKGTITDDTIVFDSKQYLGNDTSYFFYFFGVTVNDNNLILEDQLICSYDKERQIITSSPNQGMIINCSPDKVYWMDFFQNPVIKRQGNDINPIPANPTINRFDDKMESMGYCYMSFTLPNYSVDKDLLDTENMWYQIYIDDDPMVFEPEEFGGLPEATTDIPYKFRDDYGGISANGTSHKLYLSISGFDTIGVRLFNSYEDKTYMSEVVTLDIATGQMTTNIDQLTWQEEESIEYYDLSGRRINNPDKGIFVKRTHLSNGETITEKLRL